MSELFSSRTDRADFQETSDPGLSHAADSGGANLLSYGELFRLWERQQWSAQDIDFSQDRIDWRERVSEEDRRRRLYGWSTFFVGEQRVSSELAPFIRAAPTEPIRLFLCTQIADEARHVAFFDRFHAEVGSLTGDDTQARVEEANANINDDFRLLFDEMLRSRADRLAADPGDLEALVEGVTVYHMVIEGMLAITGQHFMVEYNESQGTMPGFVAGLTNVARDEHRHVAFGAAFLREMAARDDRYREAVRRTLVECGPAVQGVLRPPWAEEGESMFGYSPDDLRGFALTALQRRMTVIGLTF